MQKASDSKSLQLRLDKHFVACAAAAVGVIGVVADDASAVVQYSGVQNVDITNSGQFGIYLNLETGAFVNNGPGTGVPGFDINVWSFAREYPAGSGAFYPYVATYTPGGINNRVVGTGAFRVSRLANGAPIGPGGPFISNTVSVGFMIYGDPSLYGNWSPVPTTGFIGLKFQTSTDVGANVHFGWLRVNIGNSSPFPPDSTSRYQATVVDWAWETSANTPINAGDVGGMIPEPSAAALGLLAIGSLGSRIWRKRA